jgi:hypothetical protein
VYRIADAVFTRHREMLDIRSAAAATVPANLSTTFLPYPTALRYYNFAGASIIRRG